MQTRIRRRHSHGRGRGRRRRRRNDWYGFGIPKNTPAEIVDKLNKEINAGLADPKMQARRADFGGRPLVVSPADFGQLIADETEKWAKVINSAGIKAE
jgi:tripartite-type tricarboxylate transporter receptor subunit TctC